MAHGQTGENNMGIKDNFTIYLKECCGVGSVHHFSFRYFGEKLSGHKDIMKIVRAFFSVDTDHNNNISA